MKETPLLFIAAMARAALDGSKTMTRRITKWRNVKPGLNLSFSGLSASDTPAGWVLESASRTSSEWRCDPTQCPYGKPGDRIWGRETFYAWGRWETRFNAKKGRDEWHFVDMTLESGKVYCYAADGNHPVPMRSKRDAGVTLGWWKRPAIFMPRAASRITLEIVSVNVERLQDISEADAKAEGVAEYARGALSPESQRNMPAAEQFAYLWSGVNGRESWDANPYVWVVEFKVVKP